MADEPLVTVGCDPEIPMIDRKKYEQHILKVIPICGLVGGTKGSPRPISDKHGQAVGGLLEDGVMLELNPLADRSPYILATKTYSLRIAAQDIVGPQYAFLTSKDTFNFDSRDLAKFPAASVFGCSADIDAYSPEVPRTGLMEKAMAEYGDNIRFAGGHMHLGISPWPDNFPRWIAAKFLDLLLGMPLIMEDGGGRTIRAEYYGKPGIYRETPYGIEYRTPSPTWVEHVRTPSSGSALARLKAIGNLFANFKDTQDELVSIYNSVDWNRFRDNFDHRDTDAIVRQVQDLTENADNGRFIVLGGRAFDLFNSRSLRDPAANLSTCWDNSDPTFIFKSKRPTEDLENDMFNRNIINDAAMERVRRVLRGVRYEPGAIQEAPAEAIENNWLDEPEEIDLPQELLDDPDRFLELEAQRDDDEEERNDGE